MTLHDYKFPDTCSYKGKETNKTDKGENVYNNNYVLRIILYESDIVCLMILFIEKVCMGFKPILIFCLCVLIGLSSFLYSRKQ